MRIPATAVSRGIGIGHAVLLNGDQTAAYHSAIEPEQVKAEIERFRSAVRRATDELKDLVASGKSNLPVSAPDIFGVHLLILEGSSFITSMESSIRNDLLNADCSVAKAAEDFVERQKSVADEHLRDKYLDVQDVADRLRRTLGPQPSRENGGSGSVLIVSELMPSRLIEIAKSGPTAIISEHGGWTSHASILARELRIPVVTGVRNIESVVREKDQIIVDGIEGQIIIRPTRETVDHFLTFTNHPISHNDRPVDEVVKSVADEQQLRGGGVQLALVGVAMAEQHELFEREEHEDPREQRAEHRLRREQRERLGKDVEQRDAEQRADGVADQPRHQTRADVRRKRNERRGDEQAAAATEEAQAERGREHVHATF